MVIAFALPVFRFGHAPFDSLSKLFRNRNTFGINPTLANGNSRRKKFPNWYRVSDMA
jgi:hypothetical protein